MKELIFDLLQKGFKIHKDLYYTNGNEIYYAEKKYSNTKFTLRLQIQTIWCSESGLFIGEVTSFSGRGSWIQKPIPAPDFLTKFSQL